MEYGDIKGKGRVYTESGELILGSGERINKSIRGVLHRSWVRYKLGWRTIMFQGYGEFTLTNDRVIYLEVPEYIENIHAFNIDHELGDFGGWEYHAHSMRRAAMLNAYLFFELPLAEITEFKHKKEQTVILVVDKKNKYKIVVELDIGKEIEDWQNKNIIHY